MPHQGSPHVTPIAAVWLDDALYFSTGPAERKAKNLALNSRCAITTGGNVLEGLDIVVEGDAVKVTDEARLPRLADGYAAKYDQLFRFTVRDGAFYREGSEIEVLVYELAHDGLRVRQGHVQPDLLAPLTGVVIYNNVQCRATHPGTCRLTIHHREGERS